jgi:hypothetical protein
VRIEFDDGVNSEGAGDAFQTVVEYMKGLLVVVAPADGSSAFDALLLGGNEDDDSELDEVRVQRVDDVDLVPVGEPRYVRVKVLRIRS